MQRKINLSDIKWIIGIICCTLLASTSFCQSNGWTKIAELPNNSKITAVSIDRYGLLYIANELGNIQKYDSTGVLLLTYSPSKKADITSLEAWRNINIFVYYRSFQEFFFLDRFLAPSTSTKFKQGSIGFGRIATPSYDNNLWVIDERDFSLKKYGLLSGTIELSTPLDLLLDPSFYDLNDIREYQNLVYINDKNSGILVFDNFGNYKTKIPIVGLSTLNFYNDELYWLENDSLKFLNCYTYAERLESLPENNEVVNVLYAKNNMYVIRKKSISVYKR